MSSVRSVFVFTIVTSTVLLSVVFLTDIFQVSNFRLTKLIHVAAIRSNTLSINDTSVSKLNHQEPDFDNTQPDIPKSLDNHTINPEGTLLTLYTTLKTAAHKNVSSRNVILNWAQLLPYIQPVLFIQASTPQTIIDLAIKHSWKIESVPRESPSGVPIFKDLYFQAKTIVSSIFYGFSNGDILFDASLVATMEEIVARRREKSHLSRCLVIGKRKNFPIGNLTLYKLDDVTNKLEKMDFFQNSAEDYFLIADEHFPWMKIPDLVVGRPGYDNFVVSQAIQDGVSVIDASLTIGALHQTSTDGDHAGFVNADSGYNYKLIGRYKYHFSGVSSAQYRTKWNHSDVIIV